MKKVKTITIKYNNVFFLNKLSWLFKSEII
jgi:hypothetical protein